MARAANAVNVQQIRRAAPDRGAALVTTRVLLRDQCLKIRLATTGTPAGTPMAALPVKRVLVFAATGIFTAMISGKWKTSEGTS
jgi:hypothetical protein